MPLFKIGDFNPNYREDAFDGGEVKGLDVYAGQRTNEKIGSIHDVLVDSTGRFRYLVIDTGFWIFGKKVLLPIGRCRVEVDAQRIYAIGISTKEQAEKLPEYDDRMTVDYDYEERVRRVYRTPTLEASVPVEMSPPVQAPAVTGRAAQAATPPAVSNQPSLALCDRNTYSQKQVPSSNPAHPAAYDRHTYTYAQDPLLYQMNDQEHQKLRLYEERLVANKSRRQTSEVGISKRVETETARVSVPVEKERVVIERRTPEDVVTAVNPGALDFREGEVAHLKLYEETADIGKQAFVREEVSVRKEIEQDTIDATEILRREELEVDVNGKPVVEPQNRR